MSQIRIKLFQNVFVEVMDQTFVYSAEALLGCFLA